MAAGAARIRVTFQVDADGLLAVSAREATTGVEASVTVKPSYGLEDRDIERMLRDSVEHAKDDMLARALQEAMVDARRLLAAVEAALAVDGALLADAERAEVEGGMAALRAAMDAGDPRAIKRASEALNRVTEPFAARRMDVSVKRALAGQKIASFDG
jgi:molecular chaperone HscA